MIKKYLTVFVVFFNDFVDLDVVLIGLGHDVGLAVGAPLDQGGVVEFHVAPPTFVLLLEPVLDEPDQDRAILRGRGQVFSVFAKVQVQDAAGVALEAGHQPGVPERRRFLLTYSGAGGLKVHS